MRYLIDTHIILWALTEPKKISTEIKAVLVDESNDIFFSSINLWEISIKFGLGKLDLGGLEPSDILEKLDASFFECHYPDTDTFATVHQLPLVHSDPFDRILIWSCVNNDITFISSDKLLRGYREHGLKLLIND